MADPPYKGSAFLAPYNDELHLFVAMNDPDKGGQCLLLMVTTIRKRRHDPACVIQAGEHEFIRHPSYVLYRTAETALARHITNMIDKKIYVPKADVSQELFEKLANGIFDSDEIRPRVIAYARSAGI